LGDKISKYSSHGLVPDNNPVEVNKSGSLADVKVASVTGSALLRYDAPLTAHRATLKRVYRPTGVVSGGIGGATQSLLYFLYT